MGTNGYTDENKTCVDCNTDFVFSAKEQQFFESKGFTPPKRCKSCAAQKKREREARGG